LGGSLQRAQSLLVVLQRGKSIRIGGFGLAKRPVQNSIYLHALLKKNATALISFELN